MSVFAPGALAGMFVSTDARTFKEPPAGWNIGSGAHRRATSKGRRSLWPAISFAPASPACRDTSPSPIWTAARGRRSCFPAYVAGFNLAESFYLSIPYLSWQNVVIGDPLCAPFTKTEVATADLAPAADPDTELPQFFSDRRLAVLESYDVRPGDLPADVEGECPSAPRRPARRGESPRGSHDRRADVERRAFRSGDHLRCAWRARTARWSGTTRSSRQPQTMSAR